MTRKQVAQRLGKSLATVRRIEGVLLHPRRDANGVHRFDRNEVETLARDVDDGRLTLARELRRSAGLSDRKPECARCGALQEQIDDLRAEAREADSAHERAVAALRAEYENEAQALVDQVTELLAVMEA